MVVSALLLGLVNGCKINDPDYYLPSDEELGSMPERGSIADINNRRGAGGQRAAEASGPQPMTFLVAHDKEGRPLFVECRRSSGDPRLDRVAQRYIISEYRFPAGEANTVMLTLDPEDLPRE